MSVTRVGATKKYSDNWDKIFAGGDGKRRAGATKSTAKPARKSPKKAAKASKKQGKKRAAKGKR